MSKLTDNLPHSWLIETIEELCTLNPKHDKELSDDLEVSFVPMATVNEKTGTIPSDTERRKLGEVKKGYTHFADGDVIFAKITPCMENGKSAVAQNLCNGLACGSTEFYALRSYGGVLPNYLHYFLRQQSYYQKASGAMVGVVGQRRVPKDFILNTEIPLPPLNEQRRIVAKIEALKARSQRVKEELEAIPALLDQFRQSVLAAAFRGDLTADWREKNPDVEPASVLLERIRAERRRRWEEAELEKMKAQGKTPKDDKWKEKYQEPELINQEDQDLPEIPEGWCWVRLDELASDIPRSMQSGPFGSNLLHSEFQDTGILAIGIDNVLDGRFTLGSEHRISLEKYKELEKYTARPLDVLITVMSTVGRCCVVPPDIETAIITKHVYRISPKHELINSYFMMNALRGSTEVLRQIRCEIRGQTRPGINSQTLRNLVIPIPPRLEQEQILGAINKHFDSMNRVGRILNELGVRTSLLDQSILAKAFRGELVPQDPNDEPASVLLERIRAEREKLDTKKKAKGKTEKKSRKAKPEAAEPEQLSLPGFE